jgi:uncharacterized membrane-anchored protein
MRHKSLWSFAALVLILIVVNYSIYQKETVLSSGKTVCLRLAPVDPRSLMQGDYMRLHFALADTLRSKISPEDRKHPMDGRVLLHVDANCSASFVDLYHGQMMKEGQIILRYRVAHGTVKIASNAFFFQEGKGKQYQKAQYGIFKLDTNGNPLLFDLADTNLRRLSQVSNTHKK